MRWLKVPAIVGAILFALVMLVSMVYHRSECAWYGYQTDRTTRYAAFTGCLVQMPTGWAPRYELRTEQ